MKKADKKIREQRKEQIKLVTPKRGKRINYTQMRTGETTDRNEKIVKCPACKRKGARSKYYGVVHRATLKDLKQAKLYYQPTEYCLYA